MGRVPSGTLFLPFYSSIDRLERSGNGGRTIYAVG